MEQTECAVCGALFSPPWEGARFCGESCRAIGRLAAQRETARRRRVRRPAVSIAQVLAFAERYAAATGRYPDYGEAVCLIEQEVRI